MLCQMLAGTVRFYNSLSFHSLKSLSAFLMHVVAIGIEVLRSLCWKSLKLLTAPLGRNKEAMAFLCSLLNSNFMHVPFNFFWSKIMCVTQAHGTFEIFYSLLIVNKCKEVGSERLGKKFSCCAIYTLLSTYTFP